ncbi:MAG TPA: ribonuclease HII [Candidatus Paceibacterota bacterium]|nr:ribonuclease HII [Candidatus Paceibacterota bacterium]
MRTPRYIIGIDEAGRGPLAGPVAVGAVVVPIDFDWSSVAGAKDSKKMTPKSREVMYKKMLLLRKAGKLDFAVAFSSAALIDTHGIVPAVQSALNRALRHFPEVEPRETMVLLDGGLRAPSMFSNQKTIIRGDQSEPVISLASIATKVTRDRLMVRIAKKYPPYGFEIHKGYGTIAHRAAIKNHGLSNFHRATFCKRLSP